MAAVKQYLYKVYDSAGNYIGVWDDVVSDFSTSEQINSSGSQVQVILARPADDFGEGIDVDFDFVVHIYAIDGDEPSGDPEFVGYISSYTPVFGENEQIEVNIWGFGAKLDSYIITSGESNDVSQNTTDTFENTGFNIPGPEYVRTQAQTFQPATTGLLSRIELKIAGASGFASIPVTVAVRNGVPSATESFGYAAEGTTLGIATTNIVSDDATVVSFAFAEPISVTAGTTYWFEVQCADQQTVPGFPGFYSYASVYDTTTNPYANGNRYYGSKQSGLLPGDASYYTSSPTSDLWFNIYLTTGSTTAAYNSYDPSDILKSILDDYQNNGGELSYIDSNRTNLIYNPSFEIGLANTTLENNSAGAPTISRDATMYKYGSASCKVVLPAIGQTEEWRYKVRCNDSNYLTITNGTTYTLSVWVRGSSARTFKIAVEDYGGVTGYYSTAQTATTTGFARHTLTFTATASTTMTANLILNDLGKAWTCWFDGMLFEESSTVGDYFDGSFPANAPYEYEWSGAENNSPSTEVGTTIDQTDTTVSYTFNTNTVWEGMKKCLDLAPAGWYLYIDQSTNLVHFHVKANVARHRFIMGKDIIDVSPEKRTEDIVNTVYFTGGGDPPLFTVYTAPDSIALYGPRVKRYVDQRVTVASTAQAIATSIIDEHRAPELRLNISIADNSVDSRKGYDLESITIGDMIAIRNVEGYGPTQWDISRWDVDYWDFNIQDLSSPVLQIVRLERAADHYTIFCSTVPPDVSKRIEDINRNLEASQTVNNPSVAE